MTRFPGLDKAKIAGMIAKPVSFRPATRIPLETVQAGKASKADDRAESELQRDCENVLRHRGILFRFHMDRPKGNMDGVPDLIFAYRPAGKAYAIPCAVELKVKGGSVKPNQDKRIEEMQLDGWNVAGVWSVPEFREFLDKMENKEDVR